MKSRVVILTLFILGSPLAPGQEEIGNFFIDRTLRVDYYRTGDSADDMISLDQLSKEGTWAGNPRSLIDPFNIGRYRATLYDVASNELIYSRGYDTYFGEYRTTSPAKKGIKRTFHETVLVPFPHSLILLVLEKRDRQNLYHPQYTLRIDPDDYHIVTETPARGDEVVSVVKSGNPHESVDLVIVAEGYTIAEKEKFKNDLRRFGELLFAWEPYTSYRQKFNISGIFSSSPESGVDEPRQRVYKHTLLGSGFNALDSDRYLLTEQNRLLRDIAAQVPYDAVLVMVNSKRYGGGGIYNAFTMFTSDGPWGEFVFQHEFGHSFAGLADEYYTSDVSYDQFFPPGVEPSEPNITTLLDPGRLKWRELVSPGLAVPTPWGQEFYDSLTAARDSLVRLQAENTARPSVDTTTRMSESIREINARLRAFLQDHPLKGKIGAFQGGGYVPIGIYRPTLNSLMNQFDANEKRFYAVNEQAIIRMIRFYTETR